MDRDEVVRRLQGLAQELGKETLTQQDVRKSQHISEYWIRKHFRNQASALEAAGLQPSRVAKGMATSDDELLIYLADLKRRLHRQPTATDINADGEFSEKIFQTRFGSVSNALLQLKDRERAQQPPVSTLASRALGEELSFVHTSPDFADSAYGAKVTSIKDTVRAMLQRAEQSIRISTRQMDMFEDELIRLKQANPDLEITVLSRGPEQAEGPRKRIAGRALERMREAGIKLPIEQALLHSRMVVIDEQEVLVSSADLDYTQMEKEFNAGIWTDNQDVVAEAIRYFDNLLKSPTVK